MIQLITDQAAEVPVVIFFRNDEGVETITVHERLGALITVQIFLIDERRFGCHIRLLRLIELAIAFRPSSFFILPM